MFKLSEVRDVWTRVWGAGVSNMCSSGSPVNADGTNLDIDAGVAYIVNTVE